MVGLLDGDMNLLSHGRLFRLVAVAELLTQELFQFARES